MLPRHARAIDRLRQRFEAEPGVVGLVVIGSVARGDARERSDLDCCLVVTADELARRTARSELSFKAEDLEVPAGGSIVDLAFLRDAAERAPEPTRYAFVGAKVVFAHDPEVEALLTRIPVYQERERLEKMTSFVSQLPVHLSYLELAERSANAWLLAQTAVEIVLFGGRLVLAHNRVLFPNRKQFIRALAAAVEKPDGLVELADELMRRPSIAAARRFCDLVMRFQEWPAPPEGYWARFQRDREINWRNGPPALADS